MTNIFLVDPDIVLIRLHGEPDAGYGSPEDEATLHQAWGHIPHMWKNKPRIALISNPIERFQSVVNATNLPSQSQGTPEKAYDVAIKLLENAKISFDQVSGYPREALKQNLLPQTHPFNCLAKANFVLRTETLERDFAALKDELNLQNSFLEHWKPLDASSLFPLSKAQLDKLYEIYADDFSQLGYALDGSVVAPPSLLPGKRKSVYSEWPAMYQTGGPPRDRTTQSLPHDRVNLKLFKNSRVTGKSGPTWMARRKNLAEHFRMLLPEFSGKSRLTHLLACCIVTIRRTQGRGPGLHLFHRITKEHGKLVSKELNARWLVSVCDTFADHGETPTQRAIAMSGTILVNSVKLFETELQNFHAPRPWPPKARFRDTPVLFDGLTPFWIEGGDMVTNLFNRLEKTCELDPISGQFTKEALKRMLENDTTFKRIQQIWRMPRAKKLTTELDKKFKDLANKNL